MRLALARIWRIRPLIPGWAPEGFVRDPDKTKATGHAVFSYHSQEDPDNLYFYIDQWHGEEKGRSTPVSLGRAE